MKNVKVIEKSLLFPCVHSNQQTSMKIACGDGIFARPVHCNYDISIKVSTFSQTKRMYSPSPVSLHPTM